MASGVGTLREPLGLDACLDALDLADILLADLLRVPHLVGQRLEITNKGWVARDPPGTKQRLRLPSERPALIVGAITVQRPHDRAVLPLRTKPDIEVEGKAQVFGQATDGGYDLLAASLGLSPAR